jgi:hypothetical protein
MEVKRKITPLGFSQKYCRYILAKADLKGLSLFSPAKAGGN